jgi:hypothetical protein
MNGFGPIVNRIIYLFINFNKKLNRNSYEKTVGRNEMNFAKKKKSSNPNLKPGRE